MRTRNRLSPSAWLSTSGAIAALGFILATSCLAVSAENAETFQASSGQLAAYREAAAYSRAHRGLSMVVMKNGKLVFEDYAGGYTADEPHNLYSGTKSFSCAIAVAAAQDKLLNFDEPVSQTITEWQTDLQKSKITVRQLLSLTSGVDAGPANGISLSHLFFRTPSYAESINAPMLHPPGTAFQYGAIPFQIFGELMRRKLGANGESLRQYLTRRVFDPIGLKVGSWRTTADGNVKMAAGAFLTAREWAKYGQLILDEGRQGNKEILNKDLLSECFKGSTVNPGYGLTFWLPANGGTNAEGRNADKAAAKLKTIGAPGLIIKAAGVGGQKLYVIPSENLVIVRQASRWPLWGRGFQDAEFLAPIFKQERLGDTTRKAKAFSGGQPG